MTWHPLTLRAHTHHVMSAVLNSVRIVAPARTRRSETGAKACGAVRVRASADQDAPDVVTSTNMPRRRLINLAAATTALVVSSNANAGENCLDICSQLISLTILHHGCSDQLFCSVFI